MTTIKNKNFDKLLTQDINLESNLLTASMKSVSRWNLFKRCTYSNQFDSIQLCKNIETTFKTHRPLTNAEYQQVKKNLKAMRSKFEKSVKGIKEFNAEGTKARECKEIIDRVLGNLKPINGPSNKKYFGPSCFATHQYSPALPHKTNTPSSTTTSSYTKQAPSHWRKKPEDKASHTHTTTKTKTNACPSTSKRTPKINPLALEAKKKRKHLKPVLTNPLTSSQPLKK